MTNKQVFLGISILLLAFGIVGRMDYDDAVEAEKERVAWLKERCLVLGKNEQAVVTKRRDGSIQCAKYQHAGYGGSKKLVFAEVRE